MAAQKSGDKPLCVVTDVDDTLILHPDYWGSMIATKHDAFDDPMWDEPIKQDKLTTAPGAVDFLNYCKSKGWKCSTSPAGTREKAPMAMP